MKIDPDYIKMDYNVRPMSHILMYFEEKYGRRELERFIEKTGLPLDYFEDENNWVSYEYICILLKKLVEYTGDARAPYNFVLASALKYGRKSWGHIITTLTAFSSCASAYKKMVEIGPRLGKAGVFRLLEQKKDRVKIEYKLRSDLKPDKNDCLNTQGQFAAIPVFWNLPPASVNELQCAAEGAESCIYEISWVSPSANKSDYLIMPGGMALLFAGYLGMHAGIIGQGVFYWLTMLSIPAVFFLAGRIWDFKRTVSNNVRVMEEQSSLLVGALKEIEDLHVRLQKEVGKRTQELQSSNEELGKMLIELSESEDKLIRTEKMVAIGRLAAGVAHDLNNPIGTIRNLLQDILEEMPGTDLRRDRLSTAEKVINRCSRVVGDLLFFSRDSRNLRFVSVNINEVIQKAISEAEKEFRNPGITITKEFKKELIARVDSRQLQQAFRNILLNAGDAITGRGEIIINTYDDRDNVYAVISDSGEGISEEIISKIFDPFFTTRTAVPRRGIGLAVSYNIIKRLNGDIQVKSEIGRGTKFTVVIPRDARDGD